MITPRYFLFFGIFPALFLNLFASLFYFVWFSESGFTNVLYGFSKVLLIFFPIMWLLFLGKERKKIFPSFFERGAWKNAILWGLLSGFIILLLGMTIFFLFENFFREFTPEITEKIQQMGIASPGFYLVFSGIISLFHSLFEEFYWRYFVFRGLLVQFGTLSASILSSIGFSLHHFVILGEYFPFLLTLLLGSAVGIGGLFWCFLTKKTNTILGNWISHICVDAGIFGIGYLLVFSG